MKFSTIVSLSFASLAAAQVPKASGAPGALPQIPKGAGAPGAPPQFPKGMGGGIPPAAKCISSCIAEAPKAAGCKMPDLFGGMGAMGGAPPGLPAKASSGGMAGMAGMGGMKMPPSRIVERQVGASGATAPKPTGAPKFSISPEQQAAVKSARACFCNAPALASAVSSCIPSSCASVEGAAQGGEGAAKMFNGICKGVSGFTPLTAPPGAPAAKATGSA